MQTISSQRYLDEEIVGEKIEKEDFVVWYVVVNAYGEMYRVVVDGHHSLAAARRTGEQVDWQRQDQVQQDVDAADPEQWLCDHMHDSDWFDVDTGINVW